MKRLFAFGDSFSQYLWPMWPNIIGQNFDTIYNYGRAGVGNFFIFYKVIQAIVDKTITSNDVVIVQWSSPSRFDILYDYGWAQSGDATAQIFRDNNLEYMNDDRMCIIKQLSFMNSLAIMLESTGCKWHYMFLNKFSMVHSDTHALEFDIKWKDHVDEKNYHLFKNNLNKFSHKFVSKPINDFIEEQHTLPWSMKCSYDDTDQGFIEYLDAHPTPLQTMSWIKEHVVGVIDELNISVMNTYSTHSTDQLINACKQQGQYNLYHPYNISHAFLNFEENNNYKSITAT